MEKEKIKTICAWCDTLIHDGKMPVLFGIPRVSHGMCKKCYNNWGETQEKLWNDSVSKQKEKSNEKFSK